MPEFDILSKEASIADPVVEVFRATYKRRGSELYISATDDKRVQVTRFKIRANSFEYWIHEHQSIEDNMAAVKTFLEAEKYKLVGAKPVGDVKPNV